MKNKHLNLFVIVLCAIAISLFLYKVFVLGLPLAPKQKASVFNIETKISFLPTHGPIKLTYFIPNNPQHFSILSENFISQNYSVTTTRTHENRESVWAIRHAKDRQTLYYRVQLAALRDDTLTTRAAPQTPITALPNNTAYQTAVNAIVTQIRAKSADITTFASEVISTLNKPTNHDSNVALLLNDTPSPATITKAAVNILAGANIHAQTVHGFYMNGPKHRAHMSLLLTVWTGKKWIYINPTTGKLGLPNNFLVWWYGNSAPITLSGGNKLQQNYSTSLDYRDIMTVTQMRSELNQSKIIEFSLFRLPINSQQVYKQLLTVSLGIFIILLLRNFVGIKTFGTFIPVLIALAFKDTHLISGLLFFTVLVSVGVFIYFYLGQLKLSPSPRLASVLVIVILLMVGLNIITFKLGIMRDLSITLFPMVILIMVIEHMATIWEQQGATRAIQQGIGTLLAATIAYPIMQSRFFSYIIFVYPELLLVLLGLTLLIGRYHGCSIKKLINRD